jgi:hypothetical protein
MYIAYHRGRLIDSGTRFCPITDFMGIILFLFKTILRKQGYASIFR